uniref:Uncharacterized protein n=1 Tax=Ciona savignyi TaxID=51511 RepID=H2YXU7_CIOSA
MALSPMVANQRPPKSESAGLLSPAGSRKTEEQKPHENQSSTTTTVKQEMETTQDQPTQQSPSTQQGNAEVVEKNLSDAQIRHRVESLNRLQNLKSMLLPDSERTDGPNEIGHPPPAPEGTSWPGQPPAPSR